MSRSELHDWECTIESLCGDNADKMLDIAQDIYNTAFVRGKNCISLEQEPYKDCISRTELLSRIDAERKHLLDIKMDGAEHIIVHHARRIIEDMPSVAPNWDKKIKNAESTDGVRKGLNDEEVVKIILNAQKNAKERIEKARNKE